MTNGKFCVIVNYSKRKVDHGSGKEMTMMMNIVRLFSYLDSKRPEALYQEQGLVLSYSFKISENRNCVEILE